MIRTFVSIHVPVSDEMKEILSELDCRKNVRVANAEQIHLTLKFLGDTDEKKVEKLCQSLKTALEGQKAFDITVMGMGGFPNECHPRVIWLGVKDPGILKEIAGIVDGCVKGLNLDCDDKRFSPHITIGRSYGSTDIGDLVRNCKGKVLCTFRCNHIDVMESILYPKEAVHSVIESIPLD